MRLGWALRGCVVGLLLSVCVCGADAGARPSATAAAVRCTPGASRAYADGVTAAARSGRDVWGNRLLAAPDGPSYDAAHRRLAPLLYAVEQKRKPMTLSGVYYIPLAYPTGRRSPVTYALAVADGSQVITRHVTGYSVSVQVGADGRERYGSCLARTQTATLADGYLPILDTSYVDASGVRYTEEEFAGRIDGVRSIVTLIKLTVDATASTKGAVVRFATRWPERLLTDQPTPVHVAAGTTAEVYAGWLNTVPLLRPVHLNPGIYDRARAGVVRYWNGRLAEGATFSVPDQKVLDAERAILIQQLTQGWRYSVGNLYEELSFAEGLDTAAVMGEYGFRDDVAEILGVSLDRLQRIPERFSEWRAGERLLAEATYYDLYRDRNALAAASPALADLVGELSDRQYANGPDAGRLEPEPISADLGGAVDGLAAQVVAWQGLRAMARVWRETGHRADARQATAIAVPLEAALRLAVRKRSVHMPDGSLFVPATLSAPVAPYRRITATRMGSYWNLVMPYAFASGFFPPGQAAAQGISTYLMNHGGRLLGVTRADSHIVYGPHRVGNGLGQVYGLNVSRFLADNDEPDQLALSLYGMLGVAMTPDTYVSGEAISVTPIGGAYYRSMYMSPNLGANSSFLGTLRLLLVHEEERDGATTGVDLAFSTPRSWLTDGDAIVVHGARTSGGVVSYSIERTGTQIAISVTAPRGLKVRMRLRLPAGDRLLGVRAGGTRLPFDPRTSTFAVPHPAGHADLVATVASQR